MSRIVEPFAYFADHASGLAGFGGTVAAPDPRYCFHTAYVEVRPGKARFHLRLEGARASAGEMTLRVHGFRPASNVDIALVAGTVLRFDEGGPAVVEASAGFSAVAGVNYAFYGHFSEPSDLTVSALEVRLEEAADAVELEAEGIDVSATCRGSDLALGSQLIAPRSSATIDLASQSCTREQLWALARFGAAIDGTGHLDPVLQWLLAVPFVVARKALATLTGARAMLIGAPHGALAHQLVRAGATMTSREGVPPIDGDRSAGDLCDVVVLYALDVPSPLRDTASLVPMIDGALAATMKGGIAIVLFGYLERSVRPGPAGAGAPDRNTIQQIALRLIGRGHDVAQLSFGTSGTQAVLDNGGTPFALVIRR